MHVPNDDECVISDQNQVTKPDLFIENDTPGSFTVNFFRNICVDPPDSEGANRFEARLQGYKGGEGIIEFAQYIGKNTQVMVVISGLKENSIYEVSILTESNNEKGGKCHQKSRVNGEEKVILTVETDHTGMAVEPWKTIDFDVFEENSVNDCCRREIISNNRGLWFDSSCHVIYEFLFNSNKFLFEPCVFALFNGYLFAFFCLSYSLECR
uniref:C-type lectin domain-containing protein n=1 Tax=Caenorhabditis tropicalis TaxID=1561998 RepID=A0A1I7UHV0_9PELO